MSACPWSHGALLFACGREWPCPTPLRHPGGYLAPIAPALPAVAVDVFVCPACDRVVEVRFDGPGGRPELLGSYPYSTSCRPARPR